MRCLMNSNTAPQAAGWSFKKNLDMGIYFDILKSGSHKGGDAVKIKKVSKKPATTCKCKGSC